VALRLYLALKCYSKFSLRLCVILSSRVSSSSSSLNCFSSVVVYSPDSVKFVICMGNDLPGYHRFRIFIISFGWRRKWPQWSRNFLSFISAFRILTYLYHSTVPSVGWSIDRIMLIGGQRTRWAIQVSYSFGVCSVLTFSIIFILEYYPINTFSFPNRQ